MIEMRQGSGEFVPIVERKHKHIASADIISLVVPTRNRRNQLERLCQSLEVTTRAIDQLEVVLVTDEDDHSCTGFDFGDLNLTHVVVPAGLPMGALNMAGYRACSGDYIMLLNDDVIAETKGWDEIVRDIFRAFPDGMILVHVNDGIFREKLCTFPLLSRRYCELANGICPEHYRRYRIDDHIYNVFDLIGVLGHRRIIYLPNVEFTHLNFVRRGIGKIKYEPDPVTHKADTELFDAGLEDRKKLAIRIAGLIDEYRRQQVDLSRHLLLQPISDSVSLRKLDYVRILDTGRPLISEDVRVTIGVVSADIRSKHAQGCIGAIKAYTRNYDLVLLDNNWGPNFNHPREMNRILSSCKTDFLVLMDDDVIVEPGWLDGLLRCVTPKVGVVTPLHKAKDGSLSYAGVVMSPDYSGRHTHAFAVHDRPFPIQTLCSAIMLIDMNKCGHLRVDESYSKYFLDIDYGLRVWESGFQVVCSPYVWVTHIGGATLTWGSDRAYALQEEQRRHFIRSWVDSGRYQELEQSYMWRMTPEIVSLLQIPMELSWFFEAGAGDTEEVLLNRAQDFFDSIKKYPALIQWASEEIRQRLGGHRPRIDNLREGRRAALWGQLEHPVLIKEGYCGFNVFLWGGTYYAIPQTDGKFNPSRISRAGNRQYLSAPRLDLLTAVVNGRHTADVFAQITDARHARRLSMIPTALDLSRKVVSHFRGGGTLRGLLKIAARKLRGKMLWATRRIHVFAMLGRSSRSSGKASASDERSDDPGAGDAATLRPIGDSHRWVTLSQVRQMENDYKGHAIYRFEYKYFGIPAALGSFSYDRFRRGDYGRCPIGHSISEVRAIIDRNNGIKSDRPIGKRLMLGCLPWKDMRPFIIAESSPDLALLIGAHDAWEETGETEVIRLLHQDISQWIRSVATGRNANPSKDIGNRLIATVLLPWKFPETWRDDSLERAAAALANRVEVMHSSGMKRQYLGENLHRLINNKAYLASMFAVVPPPIGKAVLEVGCSDGLVSDIFASLGAEKVVGIDVMTTVGCAFPRDSIEYQVMDAALLSFPDRSFDTVCSIATLEHVPNPVAAIREMIRVVRVGGYGYIQAAPLYHSPFGHHMFAYFSEIPWIHLRNSKEEIVEHFKTAGKDADLRSDLGLSPEEYVKEMLNPDHLNGVALADFRLDELRRRTDIEILKLNISHEGRDLLTPAIAREIRLRHPRLREEQLVEHGFEIAFRRIR